MQSRDDVLSAVDGEQAEVGIRVSQQVPREIRALRLPRHRRRRPHRPRLGQRPPPIPRVSLQEAEVCCTRDLRRDHFNHLHKRDILRKIIIPDLEPRRSVADNGIETCPELCPEAESRVT